MPADLEDPSEAPARAQGIGRTQILRWAVIAAVAGAILGLLRHALAALGVVEGTGGFNSQEQTESLMTLTYLSHMAMPFVVVGAGLAVAATVEVRRSAGPVPRGVAAWLGLTWALLAVGAAGVVFGAVKP